MGILDRAIKRGISEGVGKAVGKAVENAVAPKAEQLANGAASKLDQAAQTQNTAAHTVQTESGFNGAFGNLQKAAENYATEMSKNMKICPSCGQATDADKKFCPSCGAKLPEQTVAQGAVCPSCGKQNSVGTKFCSDCGTKLPYAVAEEQAARTRDEQAMSEWDTLLSAYPKWTCGGSELRVEREDGYISFSSVFASDYAAQNAVRQYRELLWQNGFRQAGEYPDLCHLYKMVNGNCFHCDTEHCFEGGGNTPTLYFNVQEPTGGFDYVKPEPKKSTGFKDLFKF